MPVNYGELTAHVKTLNTACGTAIKVVGVKKEVVIDGFKKAISDGLDGIPEDVQTFYDANFGDAGDKTEAIIAEPDGPTQDAVTKFGNTIEDLVLHAAALDFIIEDGALVQDVESTLLELLDDLAESEWDALPEATRDWDSKMSDMIKAEKAKPKKEEKQKPEKAAKEKKEKAASEPKKSTIQGPRPDFKFKEGTSAYAIMEVFSAMAVKSKNEGVALKDLQDACEKAKIKSNNINGRVSTVMRYAMLPEGGEQVTKKGGLWHAK